MLATGPKGIPHYLLIVTAKISGNKRTIAITLNDRNRTMQGTPQSGDATIASRHHSPVLTPCHGGQI